MVAGVFRLLLSAVYTAIGDLNAIQSLMSRDGKMPPVFENLNRFGGPLLGTVGVAAPAASTARSLATVSDDTMACRCSSPSALPAAR